MPENEETPAWNLDNYPCPPESEKPYPKIYGFKTPDPKGYFLKSTSGATWVLEDRPDTQGPAEKSQ